MFTDVPANIGINIINVSLYTVEASFFDALGQAFTSFLIGSVLLSGNMSQFEFAWPSSFIVDYINPFAEVFWSVSDSLEDISALAQQIANGTTTFLRTTRTAPPDVTFAPTVFFTAIVVRVRWAWLAFPLGLVIATACNSPQLRDLPLRRACKSTESSAIPLTRVCTWTGIITPQNWWPCPYSFHIRRIVSLRIIHHSHRCAISKLDRSQSAFCSFDPIFKDESAPLLVCVARLFSHSPIKVEAVLESLLGDSFLSAGQGMSSRFSAEMTELLERGVASELPNRFSC